MTIGWASLETPLGHSYVDLMSFQAPIESGWGRNLLDAFWTVDASRNELRTVAFIDLLFESRNRDGLYGFFALSKRLKSDDGTTAARRYQALLQTLFSQFITVGSHYLFQRGLPGCGRGLIRNVADYGPFEKGEESILSENYLYACAKVGTTSLAAADSWRDLFEYEEPQPGSAITRPDEFVELKEHARKSDVNIDESWLKFINAFSEAFPPDTKATWIDFFAIPIVTGNKADEVATGALFIGNFRDDAPT